MTIQEIKSELKVKFGYELNGNTEHDIYWGIDDCIQQKIFELKELQKEYENAVQNSIQEHQL